MVHTNIATQIQIIKLRPLFNFNSLLCRHHLCIDYKCHTIYANLEKLLQKCYWDLNIERQKQQSKDYLAYSSMMLRQKKESILSFINQRCPICLLPFDASLQFPMMLCDNQHLVCEPCYKEMLQRYRNLFCPVCKSAIQKAGIRKLRILYDAIERTSGSKLKIKRDQSRILRKIKPKMSRLNIKKKLRERENQLRNLQWIFGQQAAAQFKEQQIDRCIATCKIIIQNNTQQQKDFLGLGSKQQQIGFRQDNLVQWFCENQDNERISAYDLLALCFLIESDFERQQFWYEKMDSIDPQNYQILYGLALTYHNKGDLDKAENIYMKITKLEPTFGKPFLMLGFIYQQRQDYTTMSSFAKKLLQIDPNNMYGKFLLAKAYYQNQQYDESIAITRDILNDCPRYQRAWCLQGQNQMQKQDYQHALESFNECVIVCQKFKSHIIFKAQCLLILGRKQQIRSLLYSKQYLFNNDDGYYYLFGCAYLKYWPQKAQYYLKICLELNKSHNQVYHKLAGLYKSINAWPKAAKMYEQYLAIFPSQLETYKLIIDCYEQLQWHQDTIRWLQQLNDIHPTQQLSLKMADYYLKVRKYAQALYCFHECLRFDGQSKRFIYEQMVNIYRMEDNCGLIEYLQIDLQANQKMIDEQEQQMQESQSSSSL